MERQLLRALYHYLRTIPAVRPAGCSYSDRSIAISYLWATLSDRPVSWGCRQENWPGEWAWFTPPSPSTMSRRLRTKSVRLLIVRLLQYLQRNWPTSSVWYIDGKPLAIGGASGDRDARCGRGAAMMAKGYKLHAVLEAGGRLQTMLILPMNMNETRVAADVIQELPTARGYLVGDTAYDAAELYDLAGYRGLQLVARPRRAKKGLGHRRQSPRRLQGLAIAQSPEGKKLLRDRFAIDRAFGAWGNTAAGLGPLPNWVRHLDRVRIWVLTKLVILAAIKNQKLELRAG